MTGNRVGIAAATLVVLLGGIGFGYWLGHRQATSPQASTADEQGKKVLYWYDPMLPQERYPGPGKSSMNMTLLPKYAEATDGSGVSIAPQVRQNLGIRTVLVQRGSLAGTLSVPGTIAWDLRQERVVSAPVDAIVERLSVKTPYQSVHAGQALASVLAPTWSMAIAEATALGRSRSVAARGLQSASRERLHALGLPPGTAVRNGSVTLTSPIAGVVSEIGVREGQAAPAGTLLFRINGTRTVWLEAALPQAGSAGIAAGTPAEARVAAFPDQVFGGRVETVLPQVEASSRTQRVRIVLDNRDALLSPGMFAQVTLEPVAGTQVPLVPSDAVVGSGTQARVIVLSGDNTFRAVPVEIGRSGGGMTEIRAGLAGGERVVASGQFLIDSEASLSGALERLNAGARPEPGP